MSGFKETLVETLQSVGDLFSKTKDKYEGQSRFAKMRLWVLGVLLLDVALSLGYVSLSGGRAIDVDVWFEQSFPSNMLVIRNVSGDPIEDVTLVLDGKYTLKVPELSVGVQGFEVGRQFRDRQDLTPDDSYRPRQLRISAGGDEMLVPISETKK